MPDIDPLKYDGSIEQSNDIVMIQSAVNVNMILNFGRNIIDVSNQNGIELHILLSKFQANRGAISNNLRELNVISHEASYKQEVSINGLFNNLKSIFEIYRVFRKVKPDIVHTRGTFMGYIGRIIAYLAGVKCVYHHQDDFYHREEDISGLVAYLTKRLDLLLSKISTRLFFVSHTIIEEALDIGINEDKCVLVGHDLHPLFKDNIGLGVGDKHHLIKHCMSVYEEKFLVGTIARIEDFKGIDRIIKVAERVKAKEENIKFFIRGSGSKFDKYSGLIKEKQLCDTVFLTQKYVKANEMPALFKSFDLFFLPTRREGFGMVFAEAMSMGVPVICSKIYPVVEVVPDDLGYVINPDDIDGYTRAILKLYNSSEERSNLSTKAQDYAKERWGSTKAAEKVVETMLEDINDNVAAST